MPGEFYVETAKIPTLASYLADSAVVAALPPGKDFIAGTDSTSLAGQVVSRVLRRRLQADHHRRLPDRRAARIRARPTERSSSSS